MAAACERFFFGIRDRSLLQGQSDGTRTTCVQHNTNNNDNNNILKGSHAVNEVAIDERANRYRFDGNDRPWNYRAADDAACPRQRAQFTRHPFTRFSVLLLYSIIKYIMYELFSLSIFPTCRYTTSSIQIIAASGHNNNII